MCASADGEPDATPVIPGGQDSHWTLAFTLGNFAESYSQVLGRCPLPSFKAEGARSQQGVLGCHLGAEAMTLGAHFASPIEMSPTGSLTRPTAKCWTSCPPGSTCSPSWPRVWGKSLRKS